MQGQDTQKSGNVVSLFANRDQAGNQADAKASAESAESFQDVMSKNAKNKERIEKERLNANKGVLRSYRIKH